MEILSDPTPDMLAMPRFDDGAIDMQELPGARRAGRERRDGTREADQLCGGGAKQPQRLPRREGRLRRLRRHADAAHPEAPAPAASSLMTLSSATRVDRALVAAVAEMYATGIEHPQGSASSRRWAPRPPRPGEPSPRVCLLTSGLWVRAR